MNSRSWRMLGRVVMLVAAGLLLAAGCSDAGEDGTIRPPVTGDVTAPPGTDGADACTAPAEWFPQSQTPEPDPSGPFQNFCDFHRWAWQSFLWLTQDVGGGQLRFESFPTRQDAVSGTQAAAADMPRLLVRTQKIDHPDATSDQPLDEVFQAGERGLMVDQNGRAIYYSQHLNEAMFDEIVDKQWNLPSVLEEIPPDTEFATGDVVLKVSWSVADQETDRSRIFVRSALIDELVNSPAGNITVSSEPIEADMALVGMHVVGWVAGHPEAIWATFEQVENAPDLQADQSPDAPVSDRSFRFYAGGTPASGCNRPNLTELVLDEATQVLQPITQACRQFPFGMVPGSTDSNDQQNLAAITTLNQSVWDQLAPDNLWRNYFEVGAVWTNGDLQPNNDQQANLIGSTKLSNATIETFTQQVASQNNCFSCHNTLMFNPTDLTIPPLQGTNINLSHIITTAYVQNHGK